MKRKLLIGIAALSLMGMVACNLPELSVGEDNATGLETTADDDYYEWLEKRNK